MNKQCTVNESDLYPDERDNWCVAWIDEEGEHSAHFTDSCRRADAEEYAAWKRGDRWEGERGIPPNLIFEVAYADGSNHWFAGTVDVIGSGALFNVTFLGPKALQDAKEYAKWKNSGVVPVFDVSPIREEYRVRIVNPSRFGEDCQVVFSGGNALELAEEYAAWMNANIKERKWQLGNQWYRCNFDAVDD